MRTILIALASVCAVAALAFVAVSGIAGAEEAPIYQTIVGYSGSNVVYTCESPAVQTTGPRAYTYVSISGISVAAAAVVTSAAHGFYFNTAGTTSPRPIVTISGVTGTGWTAANATWTATVTGANTFTIPLNSSGYAGSPGGTMVFTTTSPRTGMYEWRVKKFEYSGSSLVWQGFLNGSNGFNQRCSDATSTSLNQQ